MSALITAEYNGVAFSFQPDGWFNATTAAKRYGREPAEWQRLPTTIDYLAALTRKYGEIPYLKSRRGRPDLGGGTWLHPKLAVRFAQWLDMDFAVWCDEQIDNIMRAPASRDDSEKLSTVKDRMGLLVSAAVSVATHRLGFNTVYGAFNDAAGSARFKSMTMAQVRQAEPVAHRIASGAATEQDWRLIEANRADKPAAPQQHRLSFTDADDTSE